MGTRIVKYTLEFWTDVAAAGLGGVACHLRLLFEALAQQRDMVDSEGQPLPDGVGWVITPVAGKVAPYGTAALARMARTTEAEVQTALLELEATGLIVMPEIRAERPAHGPGVGGWQVIGVTGWVERQNARIPGAGRKAKQPKAKAGEATATDTKNNESEAA
jgi:hypothetical protein